MTTTVYLWRANQSEPGHDDSIFDFTYNRANPPAQPEAQHAENGLIYQERLYDDWQLVGEVDCKEMFNNYAGDNIVAISGNYYFASDVYRLHRYRSIKDNTVETQARATSDATVSTPIYSVGGSAMTSSRPTKAQELDEYIKRHIKDGGRVLTYLCPHCDGIINTAAPLDDDGEVWDTPSACPHCDQMHFRVVTYHEARGN